MNEMILLTCFKGCIVNIASTRAEMSEPNTEGYSASKGGIVSLTHSMAISLAPYSSILSSHIYDPNFLSSSELHFTWLD